MKQHYGSDWARNQAEGFYSFYSFFHDFSNQRSLSEHQVLIRCWSLLYSMYCSCCLLLLILVLYEMCYINKVLLTGTYLLRSKWTFQSAMTKPAKAFCWEHYRTLSDQHASNSFITVGKMTIRKCTQGPINLVQMQLQQISVNGSTGLGNRGLSSRISSELWTTLTLLLRRSQSSNSLSLFISMLEQGPSKPTLCVKQNTRSVSALWTLSHQKTIKIFRNVHPVTPVQLGPVTDGSPWQLVRLVIMANISWRYLTGRRSSGPCCLPYWMAMLKDSMPRFTSRL